MNNKPKLNFETLKRMQDMTWFTHAKIFDDLLIVSQKETACYILKTSKGLVVIDGIWSDERVYNEILSAVKDAGWEDIPFSEFLITHGHIDHVGCGKFLKDNHGVKVYLSKEDDDLRLSSPSESGASDGWKDFTIDCYLSDGDVIDCGDKTVKVIGTPGHTKGCMSFIFPVCENGEKFTASLFGGATPPWNEENGKEIQKNSVLKFMKACADNHSDVALSTHTAFDCGTERINYSKSRLANLPNIYVLGEEGVQKFCEIYLTLIS